MSGTSAWAPVANYLTKSMISGYFAPQFTVELIEKDFGYAVATAETAEAAPTIAAARGVFQQAITQGLGQKIMTGVVSLFSKPFAQP